ncbi:MAG TPA: HEAT repeat domain-containing protein [Bacteroidota bacterium]|nr:HEAT repeat domain-containing protein [Bacteroidota bacterium]
MKSHLRSAALVVLAAIVSTVPAGAQTTITVPRAARALTGTPPARTHTPPPSVAAVPPRGTPSPVRGNPDDPAYAMYRKAYELVLGERWEEARKKFRELAKQHPDSEYRDDAEYWIAYSYRETDYDRAMRAYKSFLKNYKESPYFDDALADMDQLMARSMALTLTADALDASTPVPTVIVFPDDSAFGLTVTSLPTPALAPMMKMRHLERMLRRGTPRPGLFWTHGEEGLDDETRLRLVTLCAIGMTGDDEKGFSTLKNIAVDPGEKKVLRVAAIEALSDFRKREILPVFIEIARNDTNEEMQLFAIDYIGHAARDKEKAFDALLTLYTALPPSKVEKRKMVFYSIAEIGNDKAIDFLAGVARSHEDYNLRREAIYYLGSIGGEKARAVLFEVLEEKPRK